MSDEQIEELITWVRRAPSSFYSGHWGRAKGLPNLPHVSRADFIHAPLSQRRYKDERAFVKIVHNSGGPFLSEWSFEDIAREPWGVKSKRPMVYMTDPHEALEKSMWCYDRGMVPLIGEKDADIASYAASRYQVDQLITDVAALERLRPYLDGRSEQLEAITLVGAAFDRNSLTQYSPYARTVRCVLALPETGAIAEATLSEPIMRPLSNCVLENNNGELVVTKLAQLVTPIVKYRTGIPADTVLI